MNDLNQVLLEGRLVRDPNAKKLESGAVVCMFQIASNTYYVDKSEKKRTELTTYMLVEAWRGLGESCAKYLSKGDSVRVTGRIKQSRWKKDKISMERTFIAAEHVEFKPKNNNPAQEIPTQVKSTEEDPDVNEQEEINEEVKQEDIGDQ